MKRLLAALVPICSAACFAAAPTGFAQTPPAARLRPAKAAERTAAIGSIQAQLKAFNRDDYKTAVTFQSDGLKNTFPSTEAFRAMMQRSYPEFAHSKAVTFGPARCDAPGTHLFILATITGQDGVTVRAAYAMVREGKSYHVESVFGGGAPAIGSGAPAQSV